jgi:SAM-dependent methyltransferase
MICNSAMSKDILVAARQLRWRLLQPVLEKTGAIAMTFRRWEEQAARTPGGDFQDEHPLPPPELLVTVTGTSSREWFSVRGRQDAELFRRLAAQQGFTLTDRSVVVDLGCGCGRIGRWLAPEVIGGGGRFLGFDINPRLAEWCAANLPGEYARNRLRPPLACADGAADVLYAYSVLTHLRETTASDWLREIARVLRPGGLALLTFHDEAYAEVFGPAPVRAALAKRNYVVFNDALEGSNYISAWTTREHFARLASGPFEVLEILPGQADMTQALAVLRKR